MKVRILSGNLAGTVQDMDGVEAEWAIASGFGEQVEDVAPAAVEVQAQPTAKIPYVYSREEVLALNPIRLEQGLDPLPMPTPVEGDV